MSLVQVPPWRLALRLLAVLCLFACPRTGATAGNWSVLSLPQQPGEMMSPFLVAVDGAGSLYVADYSYGTPWSASTRIQKRDAQGHWSVLATYGTRLGQVDDPIALAADAAGNLYVLDGSNRSRIQKRDARGNWSVIATAGTAAGQVSNSYLLAVDATGDLYAADYSNGYRIQKRDAQGHWSVLAATGTAVGQVYGPTALAADPAGNLYVADSQYSPGGGRIEKQDVLGHWSVLATEGSAAGQVSDPSALAVDAASNLYVVDSAKGVGYEEGRIQKWDAQGHWAVIATAGYDLGEVEATSGLAADTAGNLYVVNGLPYGNGRIQQRDAQGRWSLLATRGEGSGQVAAPAALAVDRVGNLYVADQSEAYYFATDHQGRLEQRDARGNWSVLAVLGPQPPLLPSSGDPRPVSLAVDPAGNLYVADASGHGNRIQQRDAQGHWSLLATEGDNVGQVHHPTALAADAAGTLFVAEAPDENSPGDAGRIQRRDAEGHWSVVAAGGSAPGQVDHPTALAVDTAGNLYVAEGGLLWFGGYPGMDGSRIQRRDVQGHWSVVATDGLAPGWSLVPGEVLNPRGLAVDGAGNLYVSDAGSFELVFSEISDIANRIQKRDVQGQWSFTNQDEAVGQFFFPGDLAVDGAGHLYVADNGNSRVLGYDPDSSPPPPLPTLTFSIGDPAGDQRGAIDVMAMVMTFEQTHGSYTIVLTAAAAHPFTGKFRVSINLYNPDVLKRDPTSEHAVFQAVCSQCGGPIDPKANQSDFDLGSATATSLTLPTGNSLVLKEWQVGDQVATNSLGAGGGPLGNPPSTTLFRSSVDTDPFPGTFLTHEDVIGYNDRTGDASAGVAIIH